MSAKNMITEDKFLVCAKRIVGKRKLSLPEEECRTAISRAYYSLYHTTGSILKKKYSLTLIKEIRKIYPRKNVNLAKLNRLDKTYLRRFNLHRIYAQALHNLGFKSMSFMFKNFRSKRNNADYDLDLNFTAASARTIVNEIEKLMVKLRRL